MRLVSYRSFVTRQIEHGAQSKEESGMRTEL